MCIMKLSTEMITAIEFFKLQNNAAQWGNRQHAIPGEVFKHSRHRDIEFEVSNYGRVFRMDGSAIALGTTNGSRMKNSNYQNAHDYPRAWLSRKINARVHLLVYRAFVGPAAAGNVIDHINGCKFDCRLSNLRECTRRENTLYGRGFTQKLSKHLILGLIARM